LRKLKFALGVLILTGGLWVMREELLRAAGNYLVQDDTAVAADLVVVLGGDSSGQRARKGCELLKHGLAKELWLSGSALYFGRTESDRAKEFLVSDGCSGDNVVSLQDPVDSTRDEAVSIGVKMRKLGVHRYLLVTSNYHTRRAAKVFKEMSPEIEVVAIASDPEEFPVESWWKRRSGRRIFFYEWVKTLSYLVGM